MGITCGIDWAEAHHDVALVDAVGTTVAKCRIDTGLAGFTTLMALIAEHTDEPGSVPVAIETDKNLIVAALQAAGLTVYAINPRAVARYRERSAQAGGKSDPGDAIVLANILRTDLAVHRALPRISEGGLAVKALARQHQEAIWARQLTVNRLRSVLLEFYPNALKAFPVSDAQGRAGDPRRRPVADARPEAHPQADRDPAAAQRTRRPARSGRDPVEASPRAGLAPAAVRRGRAQPRGDRTGQRDQDDGGRDRRARGGHDRRVRSTPRRRAAARCARVGTHPRGTGPG